MAYHVKFDPEQKEILAGTMNKKETKFVNSSPVTQEVLSAVRDHFLALSQEKDENMAYGWNYDNGTTLVMKFSLINTSELKTKAE